MNVIKWLGSLNSIMAVKPENAYIARVHRQMSSLVYAEKTNNPFRRGIPDIYYEGDKSILWVEYKWYPRLPKRVFLLGESSPALSIHQQKWLIRSHMNNRRVAVIAGTPEGGIILPGLIWRKEHKVLAEMLLTPKEVALWISKRVVKRRSLQSILVKNTTKQPKS